MFFARVSPQLCAPLARSAHHERAVELWTLQRATPTDDTRLCLVGARVLAGAVASTIEIPRHITGGCDGRGRGERAVGRHRASLRLLRVQVMAHVRRAWAGRWHYCRRAPLVAMMGRRSSPFIGRSGICGGATAPPPQRLSSRHRQRARAAAASGGATRLLSGGGGDSARMRRPRLPEAARTLKRRRRRRAYARELLPRDEAAERRRR